MPTISQELLDEVALSRAEYEAIVDRLGREPNPLEIGLFGALWSEHCGYKHTKALLRTLPNKSDRLLVAPGAENAGVVDIGDGYAVAFKIESHNHPSAVEPYEGAATGIGGIVRDILAMGARPMALMNSLRFGHPTDERQRYLLNGVVSGISGYGNCIGVPNVGGEIVFDDSYAGNPLVNAMCVGIIEDARIMSASADAPGDLLVLVGAKTGRDGIHGASGLASRTFEEQAEMRAAVQVGNPFLEKVLIEACLEAIELPGVVGMQDCGAAGITSAAIEMAERSELGINIDVAKVPRRETEMSPYEVMLSESQERMLLAVKPGHEGPLFNLFEKWDLDAAIIGTFESGSRVVVQDGGETASLTPVETLTDAPEYRFNSPKPKWLDELQNHNLSNLPDLDITPNEALLQLLASPNIASKHTVWRQYDHQVQNNTVIAPGGDAALLRIQGTNRALAVTTDGNGRLVYLNPRIGAEIAVAEACRNLSCVGATPVALTDGLNFGNPETADIQYQLQEAIAGIAQAAAAFEIPVISGNASLYNESAGVAVFPTPIIGALGILENVERHATSDFEDEGDAVILLGTYAFEPESIVEKISHSDESRNPEGQCGQVSIPNRIEAHPLAGSEALAVFHGTTAGNPRIDLDLETRVQHVCRSLIQQGILKSAHDCSQGGIAVTIAESAVQGNIGATITDGSFAEPTNWLNALFGEMQSRIVITCHPSDVPRLVSAATECDVSATQIGTVGGDDLRIGELIDVPLKRVADVWINAFGRSTAS